MIHPTYIDFIYKMCSLNYFMDSHRVENPHFAISRREGKTHYTATEHRVIEAKIELHKLEEIKKEHGINENSAFIETLVKNARLELEHHFINHIEKNAKILDLDFYKKNNLDRFAQFFRANNRISLKKSNKHRNIKRGTYFMGVIGDLYRENMFMNDAAYIIISLDMARFIATSVEEFKNATNNGTQFIQNIEEFDTDLMHPAGIIELTTGNHGAFGNVAVIINRELPNNTIYFGAKNDQGLNLFYNIPENGVTSHDSMPAGIGSPLHIEKIYRLNMYYTFAEIDKKSNFYKVIFNDVN